MCESFDMACRDASNSLQLNIKVNSENLLPNAQKYNVGSLRIPADPSWPKIPQRKLAEDMDDVIEPPCVVTLTGTPRKSRTTVRHTSSHQSSTAFARDPIGSTLHPNIYQKISPPGQAMKRRPGCADPRFKKVTSVKSQMTSTEPPDRSRENHTELSRSAVVITNPSQSMSDEGRKTVPEKDLDTPKVSHQEAERPGEIRGMDSVGVQTISNEDSLLSSPGKTEDTKKMSEVDPKKIAEDACREEETKADETGVSKEETAASNVSGNLSAQSESPCHQCCQVKNAGQVLLVVENKSQVSPLSAIQIETSSLASCQYTTQCYNVQVPVVSYQNLPLQISTQQTIKGDIPSQLSLGPVLTIPSSPSLNHHYHHHHRHQRLQPGDTSVASFSPMSVAPERLSGKEVTGSGEDVAKTEAPSDHCERSRRKLVTSQAKLERNEAPGDLRSDGISESFKAPRANQLMSDTTDSEAYGLDVKHLDTSATRRYSKETSVSGSDYDEIKDRFGHELPITMSKRRSAVHCPRSTGPESSIDEKVPETKGQPGLSRTHRKMKSEQNLPRSSQFSNSYKNISDPHISGREVYEAKNKDVARGDTIGTGEDLDLTRDEGRSENVTDCCDTHRTDLSNVAETNTLGSTANGTNVIPVETQQLLNKSYMEYYDKLRSFSYEDSAQRIYTCQLAMGAPRSKKRRAEVSSDLTKIIAEEKEPNAEGLTMEKLSALSNIINRNLNPVLLNDTMQTKQLYVNENMKGSSDPTGIPKTALVTKKLGLRNTGDIYDSSVASSTLLNKLKRKREKPVERRLMKLKTIAFFGFMMYAMIVFLPMMYGYFMYDDYEDYEDLSYIELLLDYVVSSFKEAFGGLFDLIGDTFVRPVSSD